MRVLVLNSGSSSLKFGVLATQPHGRWITVARGSIDRIGGKGWLRLEGDVEAMVSTPIETASTADAVERALHEMRHGGFLEGLDAAGHRVVHGGAKYSAPALIDDTVLAEIDALSELAPLHNAPALTAIRALRAAMPSLPAVACFDTAFYASLPEQAAQYALPLDLRQRLGIRRYGFHGLAHRYMTRRFRDLRPDLTEARLITLQLGNGSSVTASVGGRPVETSMGFTPLEGLIMGTRSGDIDPSLPGYIAEKAGMTAAQVEDLLNRRSGLLGLSGRSSDMRDLLEAAEAGDSNARLAIDAFCHRARKYLGAYMAVLGGADGVVFGGGIGQHSPEIRAQICSGFAWAGLELDAGRNNTSTLTEGHISNDSSTVQTWVMEVDEASVIAEDVAATLGRQ